jgi:DNA-binding response OmpR family regulator
MNGPPDDPQDAFRAALPARIAALEDAARLLGARRPEGLDSVRRLAHALRGAGGTYGFAAVSSDAAAVEDASPTDVPMLVERLLVTLRAAALSGPPARQALLIVEDDPVASAMLQAALQAPGREIHAVHTTVGAELVLHEREISLIVLDLMLPDADGRNLIMHLRDRPSTARIPIVVVSALTSAQVRTECFALGADEYVTKPIDPSVLVARVAAILGRRPPAASAASAAPTAPTAPASAPAAPPPAPEPAQTPPAPRVSRATGRFSGSLPSPLTARPLPGPILVAEDDDLIAAVITHRLTREGLEVRRYADGIAALEAARGVQPALVILDVKMPGMDGFELLRQLRAMPAYARTPILMLTSMGSERDVAHGLELGADDYMTKPFSPVELVARVNRHLRRRQRLLLVDDDPLIILAARAALRAGGFEVDAAESAEAALSQIERDPPDAVLSDVHMAGLDGPAFVARLRADPRTRDVPVVFLTSSAAEFSPEQAGALGVRGVIAKPFDPQTLAEDLKRLLCD